MVSMNLNSSLNPLFKLVFAVCIFGFLTGCSSLRAPAAPTTPFLEHGKELHPWYEHAPWDAVWSADPGHIMVLSGHVRKIYVAPVNTTYLNAQKNVKGDWSADHQVNKEDVKAITDLLRKSFMDQINLHPETNMILQDAPGPGILNLELALVELSPTKIGINSAADIGGLIVPGSKMIEEAAGVGIQAAGGAVASGTIAIEMKLTDSSGAILAEMKDRENDPASILPNYRDFEEYGWSRITIANWAKQFIEVFSTGATTQISNESDISIAPW